MLKALKRALLGLWMLLFGAAPTVAPMLTKAPAAASISTSASMVVQEVQAAVTALPALPAALPAIAKAPGTLSSAAWVGATAIVAAIGDAWSVTVRALHWEKDNNDANSDIRLIWSGSALLQRAEHTAIWRVNHHQQTGYYATWWHAPTGSFGGTGSYNYYFGTHPLPTDDCSVNANGSLATGNSSSSTHCFEIGAEGYDWGRLDNTAGSGYSVTKDVWYVQARRSHLATSGPCNGQYELAFWPDLANNPSNVILHCQASVTDAGATESFYAGGSEWSASGGANSETLAGKMRGIQLYSVALSDADIATEAANQYSNTPVTSAGQANVWYMNQDPTVADVTDKSGAGHNPSWANANRPTDWDSTYSTGSTKVPSGMLRMGVN